MSKAKAVRPGPWASLSESQALAFQRAAKAVVKRESTALQERWGDNVAGMGYGLRKRKGGPEFLVIRYFVYSKRGLLRLSRDGQEPLPDFHRHKARIGGKSVLVQFSTDVEELRYGGPQVKKINVDQSGVPKLIGSTCCVVRDQHSSDQFVMSCFHVFAGSELHPACKRASGLERRVDAPGGGWLRLSAARLTDLPLLASGVDAGIARIPSGAHVNPAVNGLTLLDRISSTEKIPLGARFEIATRRTIKTARFEGVTGPIRLKYKCSEGNDHYFLFNGLLEYIASPATFPGDSGAAVVYGSNLAGMHFYLTKKGRALGIPAPTLFLPTTVKNRDLELV